MGAKPVCVNGRMQIHVGEAGLSALWRFLCRFLDYCIAGCVSPGVCVAVCMYDPRIMQHKK